MSFTLMVNGEAHEVFMSFGLLNRLCHLVGDTPNIPMIHLNPEVRGIMLQEALAIRTKSGKVTEYREIEDLETDLEEMEGLLDFIADHVLDFSLRVMEKATTLQMANEARVNALNTSKSSQAGQAS